ncbi:PDZ domain-containing protein [Fictibacillus nanhaiensis]|uniref:PDZ domain-containing protein n=1 Tax=Fictibacillus nanhaiensis TaxID=742169 RepID=UPI0020417F1C|nr:PDZ domain-containing protein [Fictibacillus nanhaiensis]MCM3731549.1 PDZ domain-containing protein [Fictibacillus nanhaiensis]
MTDTFVNELIEGIGLLFLHPLFYGFILVAFLIGLKRVKRERKEFKVKVHPVIDNLIFSLLPGILIGLIGSVIFIAAGVTLPVGMIALIGLMYLVLALTMKTRFMAPAYAVSLAAIAGLLLPKVNTGMEFLDKWIEDIQSTPLDSLAVILGVLLIQEGILILWKGADRTSPRLFKGKRGHYVGAHEATRFWIVPQFLVLPVGSIPVLDWWPLFPMGAVGFSFFLVPFAIGYRQLVTHTLPVEAIKHLGKQVTLLGILVLAIAVGGHFFNLPLLIAIAIAAGLAGRELITLVTSQRDDTRPSLFVQRDKGVIILAVVPGTPAAKMGLKVGEVIVKVNGVTLTHETSLYRALQINAAYCKLEVLDLNGEIRFVQGSLYQNEHHQLGVLLVHDVVDRNVAVGN